MLTLRDGKAWNSRWWRKSSAFLHVPDDQEGCEMGCLGSGWRPKHDSDEWFSLFLLLRIGLGQCLRVENCPGLRVRKLDSGPLTLGKRQESQNW